MKDVAFLVSCWFPMKSVLYLCLFQSTYCFDEKKEFTSCSNKQMDEEYRCQKELIFSFRFFQRKPLYCQRLYLETTNLLKRNKTFFVDCEKASMQKKHNFFVSSTKLKPITSKLSGKFSIDCISCRSLLAFVRSSIVEWHESGDNCSFLT